ncbi:2Fe-2S iron-sulfur cluster-binding protein [Marinobacteraceae bacterium S3BR75-40.1]
MRLLPSRLSFLTRPDEDLLAAARRQGIAIRWGCRNGVCEICQARLCQGEVLNLRTRERQQAGDFILLCRAEAHSDLAVQIEDVMAAGEIRPQLVHCSIESIESLNHDVYRVRLKTPPGQPVAFHAGQYLAIERPGTDPAWFSIASAPEGPQSRHLELHIQAAEEWNTALEIMEFLRREKRVPVRLPFGKACLAAVPEEPLVLVAAGTGFAQMKSLVDYLHAYHAEIPVFLYWGVRKHEDMYLRSLPDRWAEDWPNFHFRPQVADNEDNDWEGHHEQLARAVLAGGHDFTQARVIASGSPVMVYTLMDHLVEHGLDVGRFMSDVLEYAPR